MEVKDAYNALPYPVYLFVQTGPDRICVMARLFGIEAKSPDDCRMLEIGCGVGLNLISHANNFPKSQFVGIDLSEVHIEKAQESARFLGVTNVEFFQGDILDLDVEELGKFDYVVAHGLLTWVPETVRKGLFEFVAGCLNENGIGYISYNVFPGARARQMLWDGMKFFSRHEAKDPAARTRRAIEFAQKYAKCFDSTNPEYNVIQNEVLNIGERTFENVFHDDLTDFNEPIHFYEFAEYCRESGLQYVGEIGPKTLDENRIQGEGLTMLEEFANDPLEREQLVDYILCRRFRSSLVCRAGKTVDRLVTGKKIEKFFVAVRTTSEAGDPFDDEPMKFSCSQEVTLKLNDPFVKAALIHLQSRWPDTVSFADLHAYLRETKLGEREDFDEGLDRLANSFLKLFTGGVARLDVAERDYVKAVPERPKANKVAQYQLRLGNTSIVTSTGQGVDVSTEPLVKALILLADGTRTKEEIGERISEMVEADGTSRTKFMEQLPQHLEENLEKMRMIGLLVKE